MAMDIIVKCTDGKSVTHSRNEGDAHKAVAKVLEVFNLKAGKNDKTYCSLCLATGHVFLIDSVEVSGAHILIKHSDQESYH